MAFSRSQYSCELAGAKTEDEHRAESRAGLSQKARTARPYEGNAAGAPCSARRAEKHRGLGMIAVVRAGGTPAVQTPCLLVAQSLSRGDPACSSRGNVGCQHGHQK